MGPRGSGKSTLGPRAAARLDVLFVDLDDRTAVVLGHAKAADAWHAHGEDAFRVAEARALREAMRECPGVVALGGGTPTAPGAYDMLRAVREQGAALVYLIADVPTLARRLASTDLRDRPGITGTDPLAEIPTLLARREALYRELATHTLRTDDLTIEQSVEQLVKLAREAQSSSA